MVWFHELKHKRFFVVCTKIWSGVLFDPKPVLSRLVLRCSFKLLFCTCLMWDFQPHLIIHYHPKNSDFIYFFNIHALCITADKSSSPLMGVQLKTLHDFWLSFWLSGKMLTGLHYISWLPPSVLLQTVQAVAIVVWFSLYCIFKCSHKSLILKGISIQQWNISWWEGRWKILLDQ